MNQRSISLRCFHRLGFTFLCGNAMMSTGNVLIFMRRIPPEHRLRCPFLLFFLVSVCPFLLIASLGFQDGRVWSPFFGRLHGERKGLRGFPQGSGILSGSLQLLDDDDVLDSFLEDVMISWVRFDYMIRRSRPDGA